MIISEIKGLNIVLLTENLDTNFFDQYYMIKNGIYKPEEIHSRSIFIKGLAKIESEDSILRISPSNIQFILKTSNVDEAYECIQRRFKRFVSSLPLIIVKAIGLNIVWRISDNELSLHDFCKQLFFKPDSRLYSIFDTKNAMFTAYLSMDYDDSTRLKLDFKPVKLPGLLYSEEILLASFNYNRNLDVATWRDQILEQLNKWTEIVNNSKEITCSLK